jgi:hypothetical protein
VIPDKAEKNKNWSKAIPFKDITQIITQNFVAVKEIVLQTKFLFQKLM